MNTTRIALTTAVASLALQGCLGIAANTEVAKEPLPEMPQNPDGICPNLAGIYPRNAYPDEKPGDQYLPRNIPAVFFGTSLDPELDRRKKEERDKALKDQDRRMGPTIISFNYLTPGQLEIGYWFSSGFYYSTQTNPKKMHQGIISGADKSSSGVKIGSVICDNGTAYRAIDSASYNTESGGTGEGVETLSKSPGGELVYTVSNFSRIYGVRIIPMGGSRTVYTYRYKPYTGPLPGK